MENGVKGEPKTLRKNKKQKRSMSWFRKKTCLNDTMPFSVKEAYKLARTNILFSLAEEGCKSIAITSAYPGEGKTTTATNMAISFAQMGKRTLLIDGDMRKPQVHHVFSLDNQIGLSNILGGFAGVEEAIHPLESGIKVITAGHIPPNPVELLGSKRMKELLEDLGQQYDYIFIDTPPTNMVTDALVISEIASGTIIIAKQGYSKKHELEEAIGKLKFAQAKLLGFILTGDNSKGGKYSKSKRYSKHMGYESYE